MPPLFDFGRLRLRRTGEEESGFIRRNIKLAGARFAIVLIVLASLCTTAIRQGNTVEYRIKKSRELEGLEDAIRHTRYSINILTDHEKRMQKRAEEIRKNFPVERGGA